MAAVVLVLVVAATLVVVARVVLWQQTFVPDRVMQVLAWALARLFWFVRVSFAEGWPGRPDEW